MFTILRDTAARAEKPIDKLDNSDKAVMEQARNNKLGRLIPSLSVAHVTTHPCLSLLYRHALSWQNPEGGQKTGVTNGFLCYAYLMVLAWRVHGDTLGRMLKFEPYLTLRDSLFTFLGAHCQPTLADFFGRAEDCPPTTQFANWDSGLNTSFVDLTGQALSTAAVSGDADNAASDAEITYVGSNIPLTDTERMVDHVASVKKVIDGIGRCALALGPATTSSKATTLKARKGPWSPEVATLSRMIAAVCAVHLCASVRPLMPVFRL